jgi:Bles03-like protein
MALNLKGALPSQCTDKAWLHAFCAAKKREHNSIIGKWLHFVQPNWVDDVWAHIKTEIEKGTLGFEAKISTAMDGLTTGGYMRSTRKQYSLVVYTTEGNKEQIRRALNALGYMEVTYKLDETTIKQADELRAARRKN